MNPNHSHFYSENQSHNNIPDPYLMGRLMGTSYANYPSAFSIASRGIPNPTAAAQEQSFSKVERSTRGANSNSSTKDPIYVPGAYLVGILILKLYIIDILFRFNFNCIIYEYVVLL